jgi:dynactin 1
VFGSRASHLLVALQRTLHMFNSSLARCSVETFLRVGTLYPEMSVHEKGVDFYIDLLHKGQVGHGPPHAAAPLPSWMRTCR